MGESGARSTGRAGEDARHLFAGRLTQTDAERVIERLVTVTLSDEGHAPRESSPTS
ncbi:hypothetical protein [Streptomyces virginiae]